MSKFKIRVHLPLLFLLAMCYNLVFPFTSFILFSFVFSDHLLILAVYLVLEHVTPYFDVSFQQIYLLIHLHFSEAVLSVKQYFQCAICVRLQLLSN
jgi:hypothetical protein